jgi:hypothetical protein
MEPNLSLTDAIVRYVAMMAVVIGGGITGHIWIMVLGIPLFLSGLTGICFIYKMLGIDTSKQEHPFSL